MTEFKGIIEVSKAQFNLLSGCIDSTGYRETLKYVYYDAENNKFIATDGKRMVVLNDNWDLGIIESGYFEPVKVGKKFKLLPIDCNEQYPSWSRVIPDDSKLDGKMENYIAGGRVQECSIVGKLMPDSLFICQLILASKKMINLEHLTILKNVYSFTVQFSTMGNLPLVFTLPDDTGIFITMPMNKDF